MAASHSRQGKVSLSLPSWTGSGLMASWSRRMPVHRTSDYSANAPNLEAEQKASYPRGHRSPSSRHGEAFVPKPRKSATSKSRLSHPHQIHEGFSKGGCAGGAPAKGWETQEVTAPHLELLVTDFAIPAAGENVGPLLFPWWRVEDERFARWNAGKVTAGTRQAGQAPDEHNQERELAFHGCEKDLPGQRYRLL